MRPPAGKRSDRVQNQPMRPPARKESDRAQNRPMRPPAPTESGRVQNQPMRPPAPTGWRMRKHEPAKGVMLYECWASGLRLGQRDQTVELGQKSEARAI